MSDTIEVSSGTDGQVRIRFTRPRGHATEQETIVMNAEGAAWLVKELSKHIAPCTTSAPKGEP